MKRAEFLKLSCTGCLLGSAGLITATSLLSSCSPKASSSLYKTAVTDKKLIVPITQLALKKLTIVRGTGMEYDVAVHQTKDGIYEALLLQCTHFNNPLIVNGASFSCTMHGSEFDENGIVKKGPASRPLSKLSCAVVGNNLIIQVS